MSPRCGLSGRNGGRVDVEANDEFMKKRFVSIWFRHLRTDWFQLRRPALKESPLVLAVTEHGRKLVAAADPKAEGQGIYTGATVADARAVVPDLEVIDDIPGLSGKLLTALAGWAIRYTPSAAVDLPDGLILDSTGCGHLWGGDAAYLDTIRQRLNAAGYDVRIAMADTVGAAWGLARFGGRGGEPHYVELPGSGPGGAQDGGMSRGRGIVVEGQTQTAALLGLPPAALRLEAATLDRLHKLGFVTIGHFAHMARPALRRRFGAGLLLRLDQAFGREREQIVVLQPAAIYEERLPCLEPISTAVGIGIALERLLGTLTQRLVREGKGLREAIFKAYCIDGRISQVQIATSRASHHAAHLLKLFELKLPNIEPGLGIELFVLEAPRVEDVSPVQERFWAGDQGIEASAVTELIDNLTNRFGAACITRFLPDEHHWPERSVKIAQRPDEIPAIPWRTDRPRPAHLLARPEAIEVAAPVPDYPPMLFRYRGKLHRIRKADGPERIEREWWIQDGPHRDYYCVEDEEGGRYWVFRSGHYTDDSIKTDSTTGQSWYLHGFFP